MKSQDAFKNITIEYYKAYTYKNSENRKNTLAKQELEISRLLEQLQQIDVKDRYMVYNGDYIILHTINYNEDSKLWELVFFKGRYSQVPFIIDRSGKMRDFILKNDEMISEIVCVEYNSEMKVFAMQRNIYAFGKKCLENFFESYLNCSFILETIVTLNQKKRNFLKNGVVKRFRLHVKNVVGKNGEVPSHQPYNKNTALCHIIDSAMSTNSLIVDIKLSVGNSSSKIAIQDDDFDVFDDLMSNHNVKNLELGIAPDEKSTMQITDFIDSRVRDIIPVPFVKGQPIDIVKLLDGITKAFKNNMYLKEENK